MNSKYFDLERAYNIIMSCANIFEDESFIAVPCIINTIPYLRISYNDIQLDFSCYKYC